MLSRWIKPYFYGGIVCLIIGFLFTSIHVLAFNGPHKDSSEQECDICHIPHHAADDMLWARATTGPFTGVKRLCASCHGKGLFGAQDYYNIFNENEQEITYDHAMGPDASINGSSIIREDWASFPLKEKEGGDGFYCGSCHDPHIDPYEPIGDEGGGDYLRQETAELIKNAKDKETAFCKQCHEGIIFGDASGHGNKKGCYDCHHPHSSKNPGSKIIISPLVSFTAIPNCRGFSDSGETVSACYGCHMEGSGFDGALGAPLAGDDLDVPREHHPMGIGADASTSGHQPTQAGPLSPSGELYCESCHSVHDGTNDHYLNPQIVSGFDPANSALFCIACHSNKTIEDLGPRGEGHHQISPNNQCLFCHSIHNAPNDPEAEYQTDKDEATQFNSSVSVDVIMRIAPENLAWSDKILDTDTKDYEDACYGCHYLTEIVGSEFLPNEDNSLLLDNVRDNYFSHRFNVVPSAAIKLINTFDDRLPIVSDGQETETINDYGIEEGRIWCGSCHNVHRQNLFTAEIAEEYKERRSAYLREENYGSSLCHRCHPGIHEYSAENSEDFKYHPQGETLEGGVPPLYYQGYSGGIGGLTNGAEFDTAQGEVVCQTCHSVHTAETDWDGGSNEDDDLDHGKLLVEAKDDGFCLDCHYDDHGGFDGDCFICHPISLFQKTPFIALPNVPSINDPNDPEDKNLISSSFCYGCHQPRHILGTSDPNNNLWREVGAAPIYGDYIHEEGDTLKENEIKKMNHHPMGTQAISVNSAFIRAPGAEATKNLNNAGELTCISCHDGLHGGTKENNFLRWDFTNDNAEFCIKCHSDKVMGDNKIEYDKKHFWDTNTPIPPRKVFKPNALSDYYEKPVSCRQCMFCHFIHDGKERDNEIVSGSIRADIDALMRIGPVNLAWGDRSNDSDENDYEDMCYGCHSKKSIVGGGCDSGALLKWSDDNHTHRFATTPDPTSPPSAVIKYGGTFLLSDGTGTVTKNDYGTQQNYIFCGTCHNVHDSRVSPYLNHEPLDPNLSPYKPYSFCEECHDAESDNFKFVHNSHPIDRGPDYPSTVESWPELFYTGGDGCKGGVTLDRSGSGKIICLTCHNVHAAKTDWDGSNEDDDLEHGKLLVKALGDGFCQACHSESHGGASGDCSICHSPHDGIIIFADQNTPFIALPNVPDINDPEDSNFNSSSFCYGCHQPHHLLEDDFLLRFGAAPIYGDKILEEENRSKKRNHHPMGTQAKLTGGKFIRAPGSEATENLNNDGEITCISCHAGLHDQSKENNFLRWDFTNDNAEFCIKCHSDKVMGSNKIEYDGKHFWDTNTPITRKVFKPNAPSDDYEKPVSCRQCMFCHFIHDGEERENEIVSGSIRADIDALMRIGPKNLAWGDKPDDTDLNDYEDMCYGCHSNESIVGVGCGSQANSAALLKWSDDNHTHRFAATPDPNSPPSRVIKYGGAFPLSDGKGNDVTKNDYGTQQDSIFCGTCHNVHDRRVFPYLNHEPLDINLSPYEPYSFCEECHDAESSQFKFVHNSHPIDKGPNYSVTAESWPVLYSSGESGCKGGTTQDGSGSGKIICLTCHNVHAAGTNWKGGISTDPNSSNHGKLLVKDNLSTEGGSTICKECHPFGI